MMGGFMGRPTLLPLFILMATVPAAHAQNLTSVDPGVGWDSGPGQRGTLDIVWVCLCTVVACTWTILHLNVPGPGDGFWVKIGRKAKWMVITILFPEFIF